MKSNQFKGIGILMLGFMMLMLANCGGQFSQLPPSPEKTYAQSLTIFNDAAEGYLAVLTVQKPEVKAAWKENINPSIHAGSDALDAWAKAIGTPEETDKYAIYLQLWQDLFPILTTLGVIEIKE